MDDMTAFDRQLAEGLDRIAGPGRHIDAAAMARTAATQSPKWKFESMFSATRFVVAGAIVALFGGFLLAGVSIPATERAPGGTYEATLDALVTEPVSPGVSRVIGDDAGMDADVIQEATRIAISRSGRAWITTSDGAGSRGLRRIGQEGEMVMPDLRDIISMDTGPDGRLWVAGLGGLATFDGQSWAEDPGTVRAFAMMPDGEPWALRNQQLVSGLRVAPMGLGGFAIEDAPGSWPDALEAHADRPIDLAVTADGAVWVGVQQGTSGWLARRDADDWVFEEPLGVDVPFGVHALASGRDGALWALLMTEVPPSVQDYSRSCCEPVLARFDGGGWTTWDIEDGLPLSRSFIWSAVGGVATLEKPGAPFAVAPDGTLWMGDPARGVVSFDGSTFREYVTGEPGEWGHGHATDIAFAPDGTTWAVIFKEEGARLYIIDPRLVRSAVVAEPTEPATPAATPTTPDLLPGVDLVTEEVEPGVYRVVHDGVRRPPGQWTRDGAQGPAVVDHLVASRQGDVWVFPGFNWPGPTEFYALGDHYHAWKEVKRSGLAPSDVEVGPDGTLWFASDGRQGEPTFGSFGGDGWTTHARKGQGSGLPSQVEVLSDGSVWGAWIDAADDTRVGVLTGEREWRTLDEALPADGGAADQLFVSDGGDIRLRSADKLYQWNGRRWASVPYPGGLLGNLDSGPDGTVWVDVWTQEYGENTLARFDGVDWEMFDMGAIAGAPEWAIFPTDDDQLQNGPFETSGGFEVAADGALWFSPAGDRDRAGTYACDGIARFDGATLRRYLRGVCLRALEIAPDGTVWLQRMDADRSIYGITPEVEA